MGAERTLERVAQVGYLPVIKSVDEILRLPANLVPVHIGPVTLEALIGPRTFSDELGSLRRVLQGCQLTAELFETAVLRSSMFTNTFEVQGQCQRSLPIYSWARSLR